VENRTGRALEDVSVSAAGQSQRLGSLPPGQRKDVRLWLPRGARRDRGNDWDHWDLGRTPSDGVRSVDATRRAIRGNMEEAIRSAMTRERWQAQRWLPPDVARARDKEPLRALVTAWNYDPLLPLRVDGRAVAAGDHVNLLLVHASIER
jgi:hypothetical protein